MACKIGESFYVNVGLGSFSQPFSSATCAQAGGVWQQATSQPIALYTPTQATQPATSAPVSGGSSSVPQVTQPTSGASSSVPSASLPNSSLPGGSTIPANLGGSLPANFNGTLPANFNGSFPANFND